MNVREIQPDAVIDIQNSIIAMPEVLEHVNPDHVHWMKPDQPWFFRWIPEFFSECFILTPEIIGLLYGGYFKLKGLAVERRYSTSVTIFEVKPNLTPKQRSALTFFREIDFRIGDASFASTRIKGDRDMYHLFYNYPEAYMTRELNNISAEEQGNFARLQQARML